MCTTDRSHTPSAQAWSYQVKSQTLENEFAETKAQLEELKDRQKQLEARNVLLEKVMQLNNQSQHELSSTHKVAIQLNAMTFVRTHSL